MVSVGCFILSREDADVIDNKYGICWENGIKTKGKVKSGLFKDNKVAVSAFVKLGDNTYTVISGGLAW